VTAMERHYRNQRKRAERRRAQHPELIFDERTYTDRRSPAGPIVQSSTGSEQASQNGA
jgi:hypothetical protein